MAISLALQPHKRRLVSKKTNIRYKNLPNIQNFAI
jgi:hypothetical protein